MLKLYLYVLKNLLEFCLNLLEIFLNSSWIWFQNFCGNPECVIPFWNHKKIVSYVNACTNEVGAPQKKNSEFQTTPSPPKKMVHICVTQNFFQWKSIDIPYKKAKGLQKSPTLPEKAPKAKKSHNKCRPSFRYEIKCTQSIRYQANVVDPCPPYRGAHLLQKNSLLFCPPPFYF